VGRPANSPRRARPAGVAGAKVYSFIVEEPSESLHDWRHEGLLTRPCGDIDLGSNLACGAMVWITACWYNQRGECGPPALPKHTIVQKNVTPREMDRELRIAA
jgi:hypothetical protein